MIISRAQILCVVAAYKLRKQSVSSSALRFETPDSLKRLETAKAFGGLSDEAREAFYRQDVVDTLHHKIADGRYFVPTEEIVEKMLGRLIVEAAST
ncbi:hypothetical protein WPS_15400 [Vulcanimicrobium alpinum]|uniref:Anti-sigma-28 factor FlgM C-terminal domain-containing protein n=1 Tax=Vulcanimicrobium alpinum TaxID=3016050 RepID=A0AAN1XWG9_UNVUL|nr:flagellar biosynthesis anti-sigma factor FlgM [Vulcanimicrobium alpinum]BDE06264.1 hypothetical protein WPS_15400 [Vulcanimicrobium alpinum]